LPYRAAAPAAADIVRWPESFGRRFLVFVDVEEEFDWSAPLAADNRSVMAIRALPAAHARFAEHGIGPAYMVDHPVASDDAACDILRGLVTDGRSSIGAQLHAWVTPPLAAPTFGDSYAGNLPLDLEAAKIDAMTGLLHDRFGSPPIAFRSGRYGIGPRTIDLLASRGYRLDTSVRARYDYTHDGGPDFTAVGNGAFRVGGLIELPLTTVFTGAMRSIGAAAYPRIAAIPHGPGLFARSGLLQRVALTPEDMPIAEALKAVRAAVEKDDERLISFSFHSPSLEPGHTPYVRTADDLLRFWRWWKRMFALLDELEVRPATVDDVAAAASHPPPRSGS